MTHLVFSKQAMARFFHLSKCEKQQLLPLFYRQYLVCGLLPKNPHYGLVDQYQHQ